MVMTALIVFGWVSYQRLGVDLFPRVEFPIITILTQLPGADPETVETTVTDQVEEAVNTISGIKHLRSTSADTVPRSSSNSSCTRTSTSLSRIFPRRWPAIRARLPDDAEEPVIEKYDVDSAPIASVVVSGDSRSGSSRAIAEKEVKDGPAATARTSDRHASSASATARSGSGSTPRLVERHELAVTDVDAGPPAPARRDPGGKIETGPQDIVTKLAAEFASAEEIRELVVAEGAARPMRLSDVGFARGRIRGRNLAGGPRRQACIAVQVRRQSGTNTVKVAERRPGAK